MAESKSVKDRNKYNKCFNNLMKRVQTRTKTIFDSLLKKIGKNTIEANYVFELNVHVSTDIILALEEFYERKIVEENVDERYFLIFQPTREESLVLLEKQVEELKRENKNLRKRQRLE